MTDTELLPGPIDYVLLEFPGDVPLDGAAAELLALVDSGIVSVWDLVAIRKEADGTFSGIALGAIHESFTAFEGARSGLLGDDDIAEAAAALEPGTVAVLIVWENAGGAVRHRRLRRRGRGGRVRAHPRGRGHRGARPARVRVAVNPDTHRSDRLQGEPPCQDC